MPTYTIEYAFGHDSSGYPTRMAAILTILERWEDNEIHCAGVMAFLKAHGHDFDGITDDDLEDTSKETRIRIGDAVRALCNEGEEMQLEFIRALTHVVVRETTPFYMVEYEGDVLDCASGGTLLETIEKIMQMWAEGDIDARGSLTFLRAKNVNDFGDLAEDDIDEGTDCDLLREIGATVIKICKEGGVPVQQEFVAALEYVKVVECGSA